MLRGVQGLGKFDNRAILPVRGNKKRWRMLCSQGAAGYVLLRFVASQRLSWQITFSKGLRRVCGCYTA
jgi:hypothetical protein